MTDQSTSQNTDREIWRRTPGDDYSDSIHVTRLGNIGINCHGEVIVADVQAWHAWGMHVLHPIPWWRKDVYNHPIETFKGKPFKSALRIVLQNLRKLT